METIKLYSKINTLPLELKTEVNDFVDFLLSKKTKKNKSRKPVFGSAKGKIKISDDFDAPLEDFKDYM